MLQCGDVSLRTMAEREIGWIKRRLGVAVVAGDEEQPVIVEDVSKLHHRHPPTRRASPC